MRSKWNSCRSYNKLNCLKLMKKALMRIRLNMSMKVSFRTAKRNITSWNKIECNSKRKTKIWFKRSMVLHRDKCQVHRNSMANLLRMGITLQLQFQSSTLMKLKLMTLQVSIQNLHSIWKKKVLTYLITNLFRLKRKRLLKR